MKETSWGNNGFLPANAVVYTEHGPKKLGDVEPGERVSTLLGWKAVTDRASGGEADLLRLYTTAGVLECTPQCRVAVYAPGGALVWKPAGRVLPGEPLVYSATAWTGREEVPLFSGEDTGSLALDVEVLEEVAARPLGDRLLYLVRFLREGGEVLGVSLSNQPLEEEGVKVASLLFRPKGFSLASLHPKLSRFLSTLGVRVSGPTHEGDLLLEATTPVAEVFDRTLVAREEPSRSLVEEALQASGDRILEGFSVPARFLYSFPVGRHEVLSLHVGDGSMFFADGFLVWGRIEV